MLQHCNTMGSQLTLESLLLCRQKVLLPEYICSFVLRKLLTSANDHLQEAVDSAVSYLLSQHNL